MAVGPEYEDDASAAGGSLADPLPLDVLDPVAVLAVDAAGAVLAVDDDVPALLAVDAAGAVLAAVVSADRLLAASLA